jgi:hypothetical protein
MYCISHSVCFSQNLALLHNMMRGLTNFEFESWISCSDETICILIFWWLGLAYFIRILVFYEIFLKDTEIECHSLYVV